MSSLPARSLASNPAGAAPFCVVLSARADNGGMEDETRRVITRTRGDLRRLARTGLHARAQMRLHLGARRIDDVVTALEGAGFDVVAVIATSAQQ